MWFKASFLFIIVGLLLLKPLQALTQDAISPNNSAALEQSLIGQIVGNTLQSPAAPQPQIQNPSPSLPSSPAAPTQVTNPINTKSQKKEKTSILKPFEVTIILDDKRSFHGVLLLEDILLEIVHQQDGYQFVKNLNLHDIQAIYITKWKISDPTSKNNIYYFLPSDYTIRSKDGVDFAYSNNIPTLNRFQLENQFGKANFFTYFVDYKQKNIWMNLQKPAGQKESLKALSSVVTQINFGKPKIPKKASLKEAKKPPLSQSSKKKKIIKHLSKNPEAKNPSLKSSFTPTPSLSKPL